MKKFKVILMYNKLHNADMWYVECESDDDNEPDYYGPYHHKVSAEDAKTKLGLAT